MLQDITEPKHNVKVELQIVLVKTEELEIVNQVRQSKAVSQHPSSVKTKWFIS